MSSFNCEVKRIKILPHNNADTLEIGLVDGYQFVVKKGQFKDGELGVYIPEQAVLPDFLVEEMGLVGALHNNKVRAIRLRGELSQGLFYKPMDGWPAHWVEGYDAQTDLQITKWVAPIPKEMQGKSVTYSPSDDAPHYNYDIDNIKKLTSLIAESDIVYITEKLHGTQAIYTACRSTPDGEIRHYVSSKGLNSRFERLVESPTNVYWRGAYENNLFELLDQMLEIETDVQGFILYGEILGVQDLKYGLGAGQISFKAFDLYKQKFGSTGAFLSYGEFLKTLPEDLIVPVLYHGEFSQSVLEEYTSGNTTYAPIKQIREGIVIRPEQETIHPRFGRVVLKSVSPAYLLRKGETTEAE